MELLLKARAGDNMALEDLINSLRPMVNSICHGYFLTGGDEEDLVQEGMIGLYKAILTYDASSQVKFGTFAYTCVKRQVQQAIRSSLSGKNAPLTNYLSIDAHGSISVGVHDEDETEGEIYIPSTTPNPEDNLINKENFNELSNNIRSALSEYEYQVLTLYLQGLSYKQISLTLDKNIKSVDNAIRRIKDKLEFLIK